jgi:acyl-CoA reductase-like NAD-dependent aldehyde dehydrogenase
MPTVSSLPPTNFRVLAQQINIAIALALGCIVVVRLSVHACYHQTNAGAANTIEDEALRSGSSQTFPHGHGGGLIRAGFVRVLCTGTT